MVHERLTSGEWGKPISPTDLQSGGGLRGIIHYAREDTQAPLYFVLLNLWRYAFGSSEVAVRALSAAASTVCVLLFYLLTREIAPKNHRNAPFAAAAIATVAGSQIVFAQEARPYAFGLMLVLLAAWQIAAIERCYSTARAATLSISLLALMLTHYAGVAPAVAMFIYVCVRFKGRDRMRTAGAFVAAAVMFAAIWGWAVVGQMDQPAARLAFLNDSAAGHTLRTFGRILQQPITTLIALPATASLSDFAIATVRLMGGALLFAPPLLFRRRSYLLLPWLLMVAPIAQAALSDLVSTRAALELARFCFFASAGTIALISLLLSMLPRPKILSMIAIVLLLCLLLSGNVYRDGQKPSLRPMVELVRRSVQAGDALILARDPAAKWQAGALYSSLMHRIKTWDGSMMVLDMPGDVSMRADQRERLWILSPTPTLPTGALPAGAVVEESVTVRNMGTLGRIRLNPSDK